MKGNTTTVTKKKRLKIYLIISFPRRYNTIHFLFYSIVFPPIYLFLHHHPVSVGVSPKKSSKKEKKQISTHVNNNHLLDGHDEHPVSPWLRDVDVPLSYVDRATPGAVGTCGAKGETRSVRSVLLDLINVVGRPRILEGLLWV